MGIEPTLWKILSFPPLPLGYSGKLVLQVGIEPTSFPYLGIMAYKTTALPLCYRSKGVDNHHTCRLVYQTLSVS